MLYETILFHSGRLESEVTNTIIDGMGSIFPGYCPVCPSDVIDYRWKPDFVGYNEKENVYLIGEVKLKRRYWSYGSALRQVLTYGASLCFYDDKARMRLLLLGPWNEELYTVETFAQLPSARVGYMCLDFLGTLLQFEQQQTVKRLIKNIPVIEGAIFRNQFERAQKKAFRNQP